MAGARSPQGPVSCPVIPGKDERDRIGVPPVTCCLENQAAGTPLEIQAAALAPNSVPPSLLDRFCGRRTQGVDHGCGPTTCPFIG